VTYPAITYNFRIIQVLYLICSNLHMDSWQYNSGKLPGKVPISMKAVLQHMLLGLLSLAVSNVLAVEKITIQLDFAPDIEEGRTTFGVCARCHLPEAWGNADGTYPQLAGQHINVLMKQLLNIRNGTRHSSLMFPFVQQRTIGGYQELSNVVAYISTLPMNPDHGKGPWPKGTPEYDEGAKLYKDNCTDCHGEHGEGMAEKFYPRIEGQHYEYVVRQFEWIRDGKRRNANPDMVKQIKNFTDEEMKMVINWVSHVEVNPKDLAPSVDYQNPDYN